LVKSEFFEFFPFASLVGLAPFKPGLIIRRFRCFLGPGQPKRCHLSLSSKSYLVLSFGVARYDVQDRAPDITL